jgi:kynureninase
MYACGPGLEILGKVGLEAIRAKSMRQTAKLVEGALAHGWRVNTPTDPAERAGTVSVDCPHAQEVAAELLERKIMVDYRPKAGVRLSPHFYNRDEEIDFALEQIAEILETNAWQKSSKKKSGRAGGKQHK